MERRNDFPNTYREFIEMFPDDTSCASFWFGSAGLKGLSVLNVKRPQFHGTQAVGVLRVQFVVIIHL